MRFLISAGEASSDFYGSQLIAALRKRVPTAEFFGVGGPAMRAAGFDAIVDSASIAVVGITEIVSHLPQIFREFGRLLRASDERKPDAAIVIDSPGFNFRLARKLHGRGIPVFYYVSPQLWAWRSGRIRRVRRYVHKVLVIFPFEASWYRSRGVDAVFTGHPLADVPLPEISRADFALQHGLDPDKTWIALLPGSRQKEVALNLEPLLLAAQILHERDDYEFILPKASTLEVAWLADQIERCSANHTMSAPKMVVTTDARASLLHARAAVLASGTATVEAALIGTPCVVVYRVSPLTWLVGKPLVKVKLYAMPNLIAGREVVPELIQSNFTPGNVVACLREIVPDGQARRQMLAGLSEVRSALRPGAEPAAERAAEVILRSAKNP
ncbi:MAG: lipid-A-disaccharide synthase [Terriglobales bacterium]|jgi:lipid-A-disaccharide synthase